MVDFGYVIVGAGAVGCVLADRLSEDPGQSRCSCWSTPAGTRTPMLQGNRSGPG
jgi:hypothetical protein